MMKRRDALKTIGALGATAGMAKLLPGCGGGGGGDDGGPPDGGPLPSTPTTVVMMMENRSYDHLLGARAMLEGKPGDGLTTAMRNARLNGTEIAPYEAVFAEGCVADPPHGWDAWDVQSEGGTNLGFVKAQEMSHGAGSIVPMQYQTRATQPATWALADAYATCDRWFCSVRGPTWPNRMYWHSGQSNGIMSNQFPAQGFDWATLYHRLDAKGIDWAYYYGDIPVISVVDGLPLDGRVRLFDDFFRDAASGTLPSVVYIDPAFGGNDDHPPHHPLLGQQLIASIYTALANSPQWKNCLFLITYDENGGFFDHVAPPTTADDYAATGFSQMGFRVPTIAIGPYVKPGHVSSVVYDHTSVLKHFEVKYGLEPLTMRSTAANDILDLIDLDRQAAGDWAPPVQLPAIEVDAEAIAALPACNASVAREDHPVLAWADQHRARLGKLDRRAHVVEYLENIADFLDRHDGGRIVGPKTY